MKEVKIYLEYSEQFNAYIVADEKIDAIINDGNIPDIRLKKDDIKTLAQNQPPQQPTIGFLMGREKGYYSIDYPYAKAIISSGVDIRCLDYTNCVKQLSKLDGLLLPGGAFASPNVFYTDPLKKTENQPSYRFYAYMRSLIYAENKQKPILGICAGAQIIGGLHKMKTYRNIKEYTNSITIHKNSELMAHDIKVKPASPLFEIMGNEAIHTVNSRHNEGMLEFDLLGSDLEVYATSTTDNIPEAWGNEKKNILCIQWHPETMAVKGFPYQQDIYNWLAKKAWKYKNRDNDLAKMIVSQSKQR